MTTDPRPARCQATSDIGERCDWRGGREDLPRDGCWVAYNGDGSGTAVFPTELDALRYAVGLSMQVKFCEWGPV